MTDYVSYGAGIEAFVMLFFAYGVFVFVRVLQRVSDEFKTGIKLIGIGFVILFIRAISLLLLLMQDIPETSPHWILFPFLGLVGAGFMIVGAQKFLDEMRK